MYGSARSVGPADANHSGGGRDGGRDAGRDGGSSQGSGRSPRLPRSPQMGHRRTNSTGGSGGGPGGPGGKTLSMENIQSLNAAYATSGPMYLSNNEVTMSDHVNKSGREMTTMGRQRVTYGSKTSAGGGGGVAASTPNIATSAPANAVLPGVMMAGDSLAFGDHHMASTVPHSLRQARDNTILDLQAQLKEVLRENELLCREVEVKESKLSSSMNSIKTFWSPELKKERALRKDEVSKITVWKEQYRVVQDETQHLHMTVQALQDELRIQRDLNQLLQQDPASQGRELALNSEPTEENYRRLHGDHERQAKELFLLRKTLEEMELRIDTQKQTLGARDESIKKLLEMLQSKGPSAKASEEDQERTRRLADAEMHRHHLESLLDQRERETTALREVRDTGRDEKEGGREGRRRKELHRRYEGTPESTKTKALQTVIDMKDAKINSLERGLRDTEEEVMMLKSNGLLSCEERQEEMKQMEVYRSHTKFMKNKMDQVKQDLSRKDTELLGLQTKLETLTNQFSDSKQHIEVLKESLTAKEQRAAILQTEVDALRLRLEEKETTLNKKSKQIQEMSEEKGTLNGEIHDLKDMLEVKERKVNVLQKKIENLQEQLRDKEKQMSSLKERERIIERLKEQRDRDDREKTEEIDSNKKELKELKEKEVTRHREDSGKAQAEVDRLLEILREMENEKNDKDRKINELERQTKDQSKKVASLKHKEQVEKSRNARLVDEAKKREDNISESSQQIKDSLRLKTDRIEELEEALRESIEELLGAMEKVKQELESMRAKLSSTQQSLCEKETHLTTLRAERRKHLEEVLEMNEKDANIALLELSSSKKKKTQDEVALLKREKDRLVQQLKQQMIPPLLSLSENRSKLKLYIAHLTDLCHDRDPSILSVLTPPPHYHHANPPAWEEELHKMTLEQLELELELCEKESGELQEYANSVLQQIADYCPDILEQVVNALEESC
ncbi:unnamed protein product [Coregonus sp. 'balchen']|nr:unnamed protein product [Coregonus sp. 'balchen']